MSLPRTFLDTLDHEGRWGAWMATFFFGFGAVILAMPGDTLRYGIYSPLRDLGLNETVMVGIFAAVFVFRAMALYINGMHHRTPLFRGIGATIGLIIFSNLTFLSWWEVVSPGGVNTFGLILAFLPLMVMCEVREIIKAGKDAANARVLY